ncbi:hypothetical protein HRG_001392 [Hirsutella rhossiliensis]|uniref:Inner membrane magnesium transporter MRS2 n=1 Tax=Hirsutella rhossiliensis TaxID=111463 RepID=A0A9P8SPB0_9HYPO|nr:inner membrane magnesium transporter MRS2 precursor [Hirsutella rhossiliensis]KAH0968750.1 inner membrane magnesium transporter MRS2 precursor [Hirsutella rhossiliensis]
MGSLSIGNCNVRRRVTVTCLVVLVWALLQLVRSSGSLPYKNARRFGRVPDRSRSYVFYATQDIYACSVLVNVHVLRNLLHTRYRIAAILSAEVAPEIQHAMEEAGVDVYEETPPLLHQDSIAYYRDCLLKLKAFKMHELDPSLKEIVVLDSDQFIMHNIDDLFDVHYINYTAPSAYWIDHLWLASTCVLIRLDPLLWKDIEAATRSIGPGRFDMEIVNDLFRVPSQILSGSYVTLDSAWGDWILPNWFDTKKTASRVEAKSTRASSRELEDLYHHQAKIIHFTVVGKPWMHDVEGLRKLRPSAHPLLTELFRRWRTIAMEMCPLKLIDHV